MAAHLVPTMVDLKVLMMVGSMAGQKAELACWSVDLRAAMMAA